MDNWIRTDDRLPEDDFWKFFIGYLTQEHMWVTRRSHRYDIVSGAYINRFPKLYAYWTNIPYKETE
jgi:hypothetical protein